MKIASSWIDLAGRTVYLIALIVVSSYIGATFAKAADAPEATPIAIQVKPLNLIIEPDYETPKVIDDEVEGADVEPEKLQYEPVTDELPILENRKGGAGEASGSHYEEGSELCVTPEPGITPKDETIEEITEEVVEQTPSPKGDF